jgi:HAMP domain-containing protein
MSLLYHVPQAEGVAQEESRERLAQEMSRLQSTLEYLLLKGDVVVAQHEIAVLAHNHNLILAALSDDLGPVIAAARRAWLGRRLGEVLPQFDPGRAAEAGREHRAIVSVDAGAGALFGCAAILIGNLPEELRPSRRGTLFLAYDLKRPTAEARAPVQHQSIYWSGWVAALVLWLVFHFLLTRRTARLVQAADQFAAGDLSARTALRGRDELARLSHAFDAMATQVAHTQTQLREDIADRARVQQALQNSEEQYRSMFNASIDAMVLWCHGSA